MGRGGGGSGRSSGGGFSDNRGLFGSLREARAGFPVGTRIEVRRAGVTETFRVTSFERVGRGFTPLTRRIGGGAFSRNPSVAALAISTSLSRSRVTITRPA